MIQFGMSYIWILAVASGLQFVSGSNDFKDEELRFLVKNGLFIPDSRRIQYRNWCPGNIVSHPEFGKDICICQRGRGFSGYSDSLSCEGCRCGEGVMTCSLQYAKKCYCEIGYEIKDGNCIKNVCIENPCLNGGTCWRSGDLKSFKCTCGPGYSGEFCETEINPCENGICRNGGVCWWKGGNAYWCDCPSNYTGDHCDTALHGCVDYNPCWYGATCYRQNGFNVFACLCPETRTGQYCETEIDPCDPNPCKNDGECYRRTGLDHLCVCKNGFSGKDCSKIQHETHQ